MAKPKVGFFDFSSCEGCQIELTNYGDAAFLELLNHVDIVEFREAMTETAGHLDIACIEGSFTRESERQRLEDIRARADVVIAFGACAATGGINSLKNHRPDFKEFVYGTDSMMPHLQSNPKARPVSDAIKVDYSAYGCPMDKYEFLQIISQLLHGERPEIPNYPVCVECKRNETVCRYYLGDHCMGMVARAGCSAPCPADGIPCEACRGLVPDANEDALAKVLHENGGLPADYAKEKSRMFTNAMRSDA